MTEPTKEWDRGSKTILSEETALLVTKAEENETHIAVLSQIDELQELYLDEYHKVYAKDQSANKDLNILALEELKRAHYFFEYMRTSNKLYHMEMSK